MHNDKGFSIYTPDHLGMVNIGMASVKWLFRSGTRDEITEGVFDHTQCTQESVPKAFESSFIAADHKSGKIWESLFIPTSNTGGSGISITAWGKSTAKGQIQVKRVSETDWYTTVKSKVTKGEYQVNSYIGRAAGMQKGHEFIADEIWKNEFIESKTLSLAFAKHQAEFIQDNYSAEGLGSTMMDGLLNMEAVAFFFEKMVAKGHTPAMALASERNDVISAGIVDSIIAGLIERLAVAENELRGTPGGVLKGAKKAVKASKEESNAAREAEYGNWGAFC